MLVGLASFQARHSMSILRLAHFFRFSTCPSSLLNYLDRPKGTGTTLLQVIFIAVSPLFYSSRIHLLSGIYYNVDAQKRKCAVHAAIIPYGDCREHERSVEGGFAKDHEWH